jgi:4-hydroxybenzoate polyprenyltransferase
MLSVSFNLGPFGWSAVAVVAVLIAYEHRLVRADDLSRVDAAFFTMNGWVSVLFFVFTAADIFLLRRSI